MSVVLDERKTQLDSSLIESVEHLHSFRSYFPKASMSSAPRTKSVYGVSENSTSPTQCAEVLVLASLFVCRVLLQCTTNTPRLTSRA